MSNKRKKVKLKILIYLLILFTSPSILATELHYEVVEVNTFNKDGVKIDHHFMYSSIETDNKNQTIKYNTLQVDSKNIIVTVQDLVFRKVKNNWKIFDLRNESAKPVVVKTRDKKWPITDFSYTVKTPDQRTIKVTRKRNFSKTTGRYDIFDWKGSPAGYSNLEGHLIQETEYLNKVKDLRKGP